MICTSIPKAEVWQGEAWDQVKVWLELLSVIGFLLYPVVFWLWTSTEDQYAATGSAATGFDRCGTNVIVRMKKATRTGRSMDGLGQLQRYRASSKVGAGADFLCNLWEVRIIGSAVSRVTDLCHFLGYCGVAVVLSVRLACFGAIKLPWCLKVAYRYFSYGSVVKRVRFRPHPRKSADIYLPPLGAVASGSEKKRPVIIAVMGGARVIGNRAWGAMLGLRLADLGAAWSSVGLYLRPGRQWLW